MATQLMPSLVQQFIDPVTGVPLAGGFLTTYAAGTSTPLATYTDGTGVTPNANPLTLDSNGCAVIWLSNAAYKFQLQDSSGNVKFTRDQVSWINPGSVVNSMLANMSQQTFKGRAAGTGTGSPIDMSAAQATAALNTFVGDSGSGGTAGIVPAPPVGSGASLQVLGAGGSFGYRNVAVTRNVTATDSATNADQVLYLSGASFTETLPNPSTYPGMLLEIIHQGTNLIDVYTLSCSQGIGNYGTSVNLCTKGESFLLRAIGGTWAVLDHYCETGWVTDSSANIQYYTFTLSSNVGVNGGATYTDSNSNTFIAIQTVSSSAVFFATSLSGIAPAAGPAALTKTSGTGSTTISYTSFTGGTNPTGTTSAPAAFTTGGFNIFKWKRNKDWVRLWLQAETAGSSSSGSGDFIWAMPSNMLINLSQQNTINYFTGGSVQAAALPSATNAQKFGANASGYFSGSASAWLARFAAPYDSGGASFRIYGDAITTSGIVSVTVAGAVVIGDLYSFSGGGSGYALTNPGSGGGVATFSSSTSFGAQSGTTTNLSAGGAGPNYSAVVQPASCVSMGSIFTPFGQLFTISFTVDFPIQGWAS